ncbi:hypothetical protein [Pyxidicoccus fallax]|uniref:hypothetical protein n=1 Tax=Pyxidicoccus fallax TaxID=394095 RepID=UPI001FE95E32|nr:hypothetical protein [Pyxidicoccus fallax]
MFPSRLPLTLAALAALASVAGCSKSATTSQGEGQSTAQQEQAPPERTGEMPPPRAEIERDCPMTVPGAQARAEDTREGVAIAFTTSEQDQVVELRQRARNMMQRQAEHGVSGRRGLEQPPGVDYSGIGGGGLPGSAGAPSVQSYTRVDDTPDGVTISYKAVKDSERERLRTEVHQTAGMMQPGVCPGMAAPGE